MITAIFLATPMIRFIEQFLTQYASNKFAQIIIAISYLFFGYLRLFKLLVIAQLISSRRELIYINQQKQIHNIDNVNKQIASIIYYHLYKAQIISMFYILAYLLFMATQNRQEYTDFINDQYLYEIFQLVKFTLICFSLDFNYSRQDISISQNDKKLKIINIIQRIIASSKQANSLVRNGNQLEKYIKIEEEQQLSEEERMQLTLDEVDFRLETIELQLKSNLNILEQQQFQHLNTTKEKQQLNYFWFIFYLIVLVFSLLLGFFTFMTYKKFYKLDGVYISISNQCILDNKSNQLIFNLYFFQQYMYLFVILYMEIVISYKFYYPIMTRRTFLETFAEYNKAEKKAQLLKKSFADY